MKRRAAKTMYDLRDRSIAQRLTLAAIGAVWVAAAWWLLSGSGIETAGRWFGRLWTPGDPIRRFCLAAGFSIYYIRILFTTFAFFRRGIRWAEALGIAVWIGCIYFLLGVAGGSNTMPFRAAGAAGIFLFLAGSWMNSYSEYQRHVWKNRAGNRGKLYTQGLFRYSRHPNYLGDLISFSGLCLISGVWITAVIPAIMLAGFVFVNIPMLDAHLHDHYGRAFDDYASRTRKLIPFVY